MAIIVVAIAATTTSPAHAQSTLPFDLTITSKHDKAPSSWEFFVTNNGENMARSVKVQADYILDFGSEVKVVDTEIWTIPEVRPGQTVDSGGVSLGIYSVELLRGRPAVPMRIYAEIIESYPLESPGLHFNNATEGWRIWSGSNIYSWTNGNTGVAVEELSERFPQVGGATTFTVRAMNAKGSTPPGGFESHVQHNVQVEISLSEGLAFANTQPQAPDGTTFDPHTGIWDVGTLRPHPRTGLIDLDLPVAVNLTADSLESLPLEQRCLKAEVIRAVPRFALNPSKRANDTATACLGEEPKLLLTKGEVILFRPYDCVGVSPGFRGCPSTDMVEMLALTPDYETLKPERILVHVRDHVGRQYDPHFGSVTDGSTISWQTGRHHPSSLLPVEGVYVKYTRSGFNRRIMDWASLARTVTVSGLDGATAPGRVKVRFDSRSGNVFFDPNPTHTRASITLSTPTDFIQGTFLEFSTLGSYVVDFKVDAVRDDPDMTTHTATGTTIFHVGPITELEVQDGGEESALAAAGQTAYTILAANNGPDAAGAVRVTLTGVPQGAEAIVSGSTKRVDDEEVSGSDGTYTQGTCVDGLCRAVWDLRELPVTSGRAGGGQLPYPTLTLIAPDGVPTPDIQATIASAEIYSVTIDGTVHSTPYFDHIDWNNTDTIAALPGTGEGAPGTPQDLQAQFYTVPFTTALVWWTELESVNGFPVSRYEVFTERPNSGACQAPSTDQEGERLKGTTYVDRRAKEGELTCYYVRAVNELEVPGYWSGPVIATGEIPGQPRLSVEGGGPVNEGNAAQFTVSASPAPAAGERLTFHYTVIQRGRYAAAGDLGRKEATIGNSGRATITVPTVGNDTDDADGEIFVTLNNGEGYTASSDRSASVEVRDDDNPEVSFADDPATATVSEGDGTYDVVVNLVPAPHAATSINYQIGGVAEAGEDFMIGGLSNGFGTVTAGPGQSSVPIRVRLSDDGTSEDDEWVDIYLRAGENYDVGTPSRYTLTITDNDGPGAQFAKADSEVGESDGSVGVTVNLVPAPTEDVTINYTVGGGTAQSGDYSIEGLTGSSGSVTVSAGITSVDIPVTINSDSDSERDETVALTLGGGSDYTVGTTRTHTLTILDDDRTRAEFASAESTVVEADTPHPVQVNLRPAAPAGGLTLSYGVRSTATRNRDYRVPNTMRVSEGATSVDILVEIIHNGESEPDETVELTLRVGSGNNVGEESVHRLTITDNNLPMVAFEAAEASVSETGRTHRAVITLDPAPHEDLTIGYTVDSSGTATEGVHGQHGPGDDFTIRDSGTVTVPRGRNQAFVPITILNDSDAEGDETLTLTLTGGDGYALDTSANIYELTILDDDAPEVSFTAASGEPGEGAGTHVVRVRLDGQTDNPVTVGVSVSFPPNIGSDNTDDNTDDHSAIPGSVTIQAGMLETEITVTITDDNLNEADEVVVLTLEPGTGYSLSQDKPTEYTLTIVDNDADEDTPVASRDHPHAHGQGSTQFEVYEGHTRVPTWYVTGDFAGDVIFQYVGGTATLDEDFRLFNIDDQIEKVGDTFTVRSLESPHDSDREAGLRWARFTFDPIRDQEREGGETVILRVLNGPDYTVEEPTELTITIID